MLLLLCLELVDHGHLLVNLDQEVLDVAVDIVHIAGHLGLDVLCPIGISQRVLGLVKVLAGRTDAYDHDRLAVATQGKLEETS